MQQQVEERIKELALQAGSQHGCRLYDLYKNRDGLQILIDKLSVPDKKVSVQDCENVFRSLSFLLQMEFPELLKAWRLEVSSPGLEKKLREKWHFEESVGETIKVTTSAPIKSEDKETNKVSYSEFLKGKLIRFSEDVLELQEANRESKIPFSQIKSGQVVFVSPQFSKNKLPIKNKTSNKNKKTRKGS